MSNFTVSKSSTLLLNLITSTKDRGFGDHLRWTFLITIRRILLAFIDPTVKYVFCGVELYLPLSHDLPLIRRTFPLYSDNLGRIAKNLVKYLGSFPVIDIGANIGDTVAIIHQYVHLPVLSVEGEARFVQLLTVNVASSVPHPAIESSFVGVNDGSVTAVVHDGTARLAHVESGGSDLVQTRSFDEILSRHPSFQYSRLLKIDTDGMDIAILNSAYNWIARQRPVLFFEYDPDLYRAHECDALQVLRRLAKAGYYRVLVYENIGDFMFSTELDNERVISELHDFFSGRKSKRYCDLCVFHRDDEEIAEKIRKSELEFFRTARPYAPGLS